MMKKNAIVSLDEGNNDFTRYPVIKYLEESITPGDEIEIIFVSRIKDRKAVEQNRNSFIHRITEINKSAHATVTYKTVEADDSDSRFSPEQTMMTIIDYVEDGAHLLADITNGPRSFSIIIFLALDLAEQFCGCKVDRILFDQRSTEANRNKEQSICDLSSLYELHGFATNLKHCEGKTAKEIVRSAIALK